MSFFLIYLLIVIPSLSLVSAVLYWYDKRMAGSDGWRIPESTLLMVDGLGGWPGGWWSQQKFRHKTQKMAFRIKYYAAIAANLGLLYLLASGTLSWSEAGIALTEKV